MAIMVPEDVEQFTTEGERQTYLFFQSAAKPDSKYIVWYSPDIDGKEPDFILFSDNVGLIVFEVKDWALEQVRNATPQSFILSMGGKTENRKNPYSQARNYCYDFIDAIKKDGTLVSKDSHHHGNPKIPKAEGQIFILHFCQQ